MIKLVLIRHGQSFWNLENRFTGWTDVGLSQKGVEEAREAGDLILKNGIKVDVAFTSVLIRATQTLDLICSTLKQKFPIYKSWKLNERHYGALQGLNKADAEKQFGKEQVHLWRRSAQTTPPLLSQDDERNPKFDELYKKVSEPLPLGESLNDTILRVNDYFQNFMKKHIKSGQTALVVAHGNSLRGLIKILENLSDEQIEKVELATGEPICYTLDDNFSVVEKSFLK